MLVVNIDHDHDDALFARPAVMMSRSLRRSKYRLTTSSSRAALDAQLPSRRRARRLQGANVPLQKPPAKRGRGTQWAGGSEGRWQAPVAPRGDLGVARVRKTTGGLGNARRRCIGWTRAVCGVVTHARARFLGRGNGRVAQRARARTRPRQRLRSACGGSRRGARGGEEEPGEEARRSRA